MGQKSVTKYAALERQVLLQKVQRLMTTSVADMEVQQLTIHQATSPKALTMISFVREVGKVEAIVQVRRWLSEIDMLSGGKTPEINLGMIAAMVVNTMQYRSVASVLMALRDGVSYTDRDGKVYGILTWTAVALWIERHEEKIMAIAESEHSSRVVKNDNLGAEWMNELEKKSTKTKDRQSAEIDRLRRKLDSKG